MVYGSLTSVIIVWPTLETASIIIPLGAWVIVEHEQLLPEFGGDDGHKEKMR